MAEEEVKDTESSAPSKPEKGIQAVIDRALSSYERLPMLEIVFDRLARALSSSFRNLTAESVDVEIKNLHSLRFGDYLNSVPTPLLLAVFKVAEWDNYGIIYADGNLIYSFMEVLFGGRKIGQPIKFEGKPFTVIEQMVFKQIVEVMLNELSAAFEALSPSTFIFERIENNPRFAAIARSGDPVIQLTFRIAMDTRQGQVSVLIPYATIEPVRELLTQVFVGDKFGKDPKWQRYFEEEIYNASLELEAVLGEKEASLLDIMKLKTGDTIILDVGPEDDIILQCADIKMLSGKLGSAGGNIAISLTGSLHNKLREIIE